MIKYLFTILLLFILSNISYSQSKDNYGNFNIKNYAKSAKVTLDTNGGIKGVYYQNDSVITITGTSINWKLGNIFKKTVSGTVTFTFLNPTFSSITVIITNTGTPTINWPAGVIWPGGSIVAPTPTTNRTDVYTFIPNGGGTYFGAYIGY